MCLFKTHRLPKISRKPIQVYKVFKLEGDKLITLYQKQVYQLGETIKSKHSWLKGIFKNEIEGEGVHAFRYKNTAIATSTLEYVVYGKRVYYVYLCEIPPFTSYWIGEDDDIAASKMFIKEKVEL